MTSLKPDFPQGFNVTLFYMYAMEKNHACENILATKEHFLKVFRPSALDVRARRFQVQPVTWQNINHEILSSLRLLSSLYLT